MPLTVIARRIVSEPVRLATATWVTIVDLLAPEGNHPARSELLTIKGIASSLIASEAMKEAPILVYGGGPRVRIYCLYGDEAITGENANEDNFVSSPVEGDWVMSLPAPEADMKWVQAALKEKSTRITVRELGTDVEEREDKSTSERSVNIDREAFFRS